MVSTQKFAVASLLRAWAKGAAILALSSRPASDEASA